MGYGLLTLWVLERTYANKRRRPRLGTPGQDQRNSEVKRMAKSQKSAPAKSKREAELEALVASQGVELAALKKTLAEASKDAPRLPDGPWLPLWSIIRDYLEAHDKSASPRKIAEDLVAAGHNLGKYPLRNIKITVVNPVMASIFKVTKDATGEETVHLVSTGVRFQSKYTLKKKPQASKG